MVEFHGKLCALCFWAMFRPILGILVGYKMAFYRVVVVVVVVIIIAIELDCVCNTVSGTQTSHPLPRKVASLTHIESRETFGPAQCLEGENSRKQRAESKNFT